MQNLYTPHDARNLDRIAIEEFGLPAATLMARAAEALLKTITTQFKEAKKIAIVCGVGNNGGDGFVLASIAKPLGYQITIFTTGSPDDLKNDALEAYRVAQGAQIEVRQFNSSQNFKEFDLIVDGIFGSGLARTVEGDFRQAIVAINAAKKPVFAIDIPSGLCGDSGAVLGIAVKADVTVTFIGRKRGLYTNDGPDHVGEIIFDDLAVPAVVFEQVHAATSLLDLEQLKKLLPPRPKNSHKGMYGHVLVIGGNLGMSGAARLAAEGSLRVGAGLVSVATRSVHASYLNMGCPELMVAACESREALAKKIDQASVIALGPGLGQDEWAQLVFEQAIKSGKPLIIDADALNLFASQPSTFDLRPLTKCIITPHPGEAARLLGCQTSDVQKNRFEAALALRKKYGAVVVLKGCGTIVCDSNSSLSVCPYGNPHMASGGMGDALTGIIAGFVAQGLIPADAAKLGVCVHAAAGDIANQQKKTGITASDVLHAVSES